MSSSLPSPSAIARTINTIIMGNDSNNNNSSSIQQKAIDAGKIVASAVFVGTVAPLAVISTLNLVGFTAAGIAAGSPTVAAISAAVSSPYVVLPLGIAIGQSIGTTASLGVASTILIAGGTAVAYADFHKRILYLRLKTKEANLKRSKL
eukprot:TRINITY_DN53362_c0_g1_i1.p1 TRINITY_DN53362_c0_g1~~TRINITY_DN53362_c0_g1_i1.p1  ORF type:complete len:149 (-),score=14.71 TRINITY_DN53362_c0_g1_i1:216-662(-)